MTLLEIDLGQTNTYHSNNVSGNQIIKAVGIIELGEIEEIYLMNKPMNSIFNVRKEGNTREYTLVLTFEKVM